MINGNRVKQAREFCGMTQTELAEQIGSAQSTIAHIEGGRYQPNDVVVEAIARATQFPTSFFSQGDPPEFPYGSLLFRARAAATTGEKLEAYQYGRIMFDIAEQLARRMKKIPVHLPQLTDDPNDPEYPASPESAARITRTALGLSPDTPIPHLVYALEKSGVVILATPVALEGRDAFSLWAGSGAKKPVIVASTGVPGDRQRYSVAHEAGHLVLHGGPRGTVREMEKEANRFAAELLMPESTMRLEITAPVTLTSIAALKPRWKVSIAALIRRAYQLEIITERQYTSLFQQLTAHGWRTREPSHLDVAAERPRVLRRMVEMVYGKPVNYQKLMGEMHLRPLLIRQIVEAHAEAGEGLHKDDSGSVPIPDNVRMHPRASGSRPKGDIPVEPTLKRG